MALTVDLGMLEFSGRYMILKHQVDFTKGAILGLWQTEPAPDVAQQIRAGIEETCLCSPIPCYWTVN